MKKFISMILSLTLLLLSFYAVLPVSALEQVEDIEKTQILNSSTYYSFDAMTKTLVISGSGDVPDFSNSSGAVDSQPWIKWRSDGSVEHVIVEEGITALGAYCLYNVSTADIILPSTLKTLGINSMSGTNRNTNVILPEGLQTISTNAFYQTTGLKSITVPSTVTIIGKSAFEGCTSLESVKFKDFNMQVTFEKRAFLKCSSLKSMTVPKRAALADYSVGFSAASSGSVYSGFVMRIYRDSDSCSDAYYNAYDYAVKKVVGYELINSGEIFEGSSIDCTFYSDSISSVMTFIFTPEVTAEYAFFSSGEIDVRCEMTDSAGNLIDSHDNVSDFDSNFKITQVMAAGQTYYFNVSSNNYTGSFAVSLMPNTIENILIDIDPIVISAADRSNGYFNVEQCLEGKKITVTYDTGYSEGITYTSGMMYRDYQVIYSDSQTQEKWKCASHSCTITIGDAVENIAVEITHSYTSTVVAPTYKEKGYTVYTCSLCKDTYYTDYVNSIGTKITGRIVLMQDIDGSHKDNIPVAMTKISADDQEVCTVENDGTFLIYVDSGTQQIKVYDSYGLTRTIAVNPDSDNEMNLGDVAFFHFDYNGDGYVNAKDFAILHNVYGIYPRIEKDNYLSRDYNQDGQLDDSDWFDVGAENFYTCGKITEEIY